MRVAVVVEQAWDPASIELLPAGGVDWSRAGWHLLRLLAICALAVELPDPAP